ncbi:MAG: universal stress protein [Planctomycetaceae bacterium]|nr:MAG: universal stress protein [Planctomycetaceae bacterium]
MFSRALVATDLSDKSERAVCTLGGLQALGTREALLVHCLNIRDVGGLGNRMMELAEPSFERQKRLLADLGFRTDGRMVLGLPHIEINRIAAEEDYSLIVVGSEARSALGEVFLGGVATAVAHSASRPVLILRVPRPHEDEPRSCEQVPCDLLEHVLYPTDFSDNAEAAFRYVEKLAECGARRVTLLHVQNKPHLERHLSDRLDEFNQIDRGRLERLQEHLTQHEAGDVLIELPLGHPKQEILARAQGDVSLVVMGSQGRGYFGDLLLGGVSHAVARQSEAPVLLIPLPR